MRDDIIAKLAGHAEDLLSGVLNAMEIKSVRSICKKNWFSIISGKIEFYKGLSQFFQSKVANSSKNVGEEICRLQHSIKLMRTSQQISENFVLHDVREAFIKK